MSSDASLLRATSEDVASAIARRDTAALAAILAPDFVYHGDGGQTTADAAAFLAGVQAIPGEIALVRVEQIAVDLHADAAMVTGVQHAQVIVDGRTVDDRRAFADFFVKIDGGWRLRSGADFPPPTTA